MKAAIKRCSPEKQLLLDLQILKEWYFTNISKIRENHVKNNQEGAQHLAVTASVTTNSQKRTLLVYISYLTYKSTA